MSERRSSVSTLIELENSTEPHVMSIADKEEGDYRYTWDPDDETDVKIAKAAFEEAKRNGLVGYAVKKNGEKNERKVVREFDPEMKCIIMAPSLVGG